MATIVRVCDVKLTAHLSQTNFHPSGALERSYLSRSVLNCFSLLSMYLDDKPPSFQSVRRVCEREREREREKAERINLPYTQSTFILPAAELEVFADQTILHSTREDTEAFLITRPQNLTLETANNKQEKQNSNQLHCTCTCTLDADNLTLSICSSCLVIGGAAGSLPPLLGAVR